MIKAFWQSRLTRAATALLGISIAAAVWLRNSDKPVYISVIASVLMLAIGLIVSRILGNIVSEIQNNKYLGILHIDLDPERFIAAYKSVPNKIPESSRERAITAAYLADGYAAMGDFDKALEIMDSFVKAKAEQDIALRGLYNSNICGYLVSEKKTAQAKAALEQLKSVIRECEGQKPQLAENLKANAELLKARIDCADNNVTDAKWLEEALKTAGFKLRRLEILQTLAMLSLRKGRFDEAKIRLEELADESGKTWYNAWARQRLADIAAKE